MMENKKLRIVYFGSAEFAVPALEALLGYRSDQHDAELSGSADEPEGNDSPGISVEIPLVVTQPDKVRARGGKVLPTPVGRFAEENGLTLIKPENLLTDEDFTEAMEEAAPDLIVLAAYGKLIPKWLLELPPLGCVNIHASLLPEYRGAAPVQRAILDGKREIGVTLMYMAVGLDSGDIIASARIGAHVLGAAAHNISAFDVDSMNAGELTCALAKLGTELLITMLPSIADETAPRTKQDETKATYAAKIEKAEGRLDLSKSAEEAARRVRAFSPAPGAYIMKDDERLIITKARVLAEDAAVLTAPAAAPADPPADPPAILKTTKEGIFIQTGDGIFVIEALKAQGKKEMPVSEYLKGNVFDAFE